ncbi:LacI family DNA-binding transcriptional regulator [Bradyrhizobium diazoefficiens]|nr:LacI family DNA-binding transcriptional regulator [Bradyrhizobium diazoefficiens]
MRPTRSTLKDVAEAASVHVSTASRALNPETQHLIGPDVVERVREVARKLDYRVNAFASSLRTKRSNAIGVLIPDLLNPVFPPIIVGIQETISQEGYEITIASDGNDLARHAAVIEGMLSRQVDGIILATALLKDPALTRLIDRNVAAVMVNRRDDKGRASSVVTDDECGIALAVEHLVSLGHRDICHIAGPQNLSTGVARLRGFVGAMKANGLSLDESRVAVAESFVREAGSRAASQLLSHKKRPTALVAANDLLALGCYDALRTNGLRCPTDISITGYNDMPFVDLVSPPLTSIRIQHHQIGTEAARLLLRKLSEPHAPVIDVVLRPALVIRESTSPPRSAPRKRRT